MHPRHSARLGVGLLVLAAGLLIFRSGENETPPSATTKDPAAAKFRSRGALTGTASQRAERLRSIWASLSGRHADPAEDKLAAELIASLPAPVLKELLTEFASNAETEGDPDWLALVARRIGDLEGERGLRWLMATAADPAQATAASTLTGLIPAALHGWSDGDPLGLLDAYFDRSRAVVYGISESLDPGEGARGMGATIIAKAAARDPDETWRALRTWQRKGLATSFFDGLDPLLAKHFGERVHELFQDLERPGLQLLGGDHESWEGQQVAIKAAATAWFSAQPDQALHWYGQQSPVLGITETDRESAEGQQAGAIGSRLYLEKPDRAMAWLGAKPTGFRSAAAAELGYAIAARPSLPEKHLGDLQTLVGWIGEGPARTRWLEGLPAALANRDQAARQDEIVHTLISSLDLNASELAILENQVR